MKAILGVHYGHVSSACLLIDGIIVAHISEERLTRAKNDSSFPVKAIEFCLKKAGIDSLELDCVAFSKSEFYNDLLLYFDTSLLNLKINTSVRQAIKSIAKKTLKSQVNLTEMPLYLSPWKLSENCQLHFCGHHKGHAASAYYTSGINDDKVLIITMDGVGEGVSAAVWSGYRGKIKNLISYGPDAPIGFFYSAATEALGWRASGEEWKLMGLAPYGSTKPGLLNGYHPEFLDGILTKPHDFGTWGTLLDHGSFHYHCKDSIHLQKFVHALGPED
ncbi:hypothetical protein HXX01_03560, partial [Candidatus Nomurabacteria bacterium]|nr:hypothetical protein [Candidatus Nomurabacteria bacterium]